MKRNSVSIYIYPQWSSFSPEKNYSVGKTALSPAVIVIPETQLAGIWPPSVVGLLGQKAAVPVDTLSPTLRGAPRAPVGDT